MAATRKATAKQDLLAHIKEMHGTRASMFSVDNMTLAQLQAWHDAQHEGTR